MIVIIAAITISVIQSFFGNQKLRSIAVNETSAILDSTERIKIKTATNLISKTLAKGLSINNITNQDSVYKHFSIYLDDLRFEFDNSGYYYIYKENTCIYISENKNFEGRVLPDSKLYDIARNGGGFSYGYYNRPGAGKVKKLLYCEMIPGTDYWIGTGTYLDTFTKVETEIDNTIYDSADRTNQKLLITGIILIVIIIIISVNIKRSIVRPINRIITATDNMALGKLDSIEHNTDDELKQISNSLNNLINNLKKTSEFASNIGKGKFKSTFEKASDDDILGISLLDMRSSLITARERDEKRTIEEEERNWIMTGLSNIADILRRNQQDINTLANDVLREIINYSKFNQGGLFITDQDDSNILNLSASYAYDRKKYIKRSVKAGEGLVGTCAIEKDMIYMTDIPDNYINITSGLGGANPNNLILIPMLSDNSVMGILELASFSKIEQYKIDFLKKVAENIASTLTSAQIAIKTTNLLEMSKSQAEELASQEEEMRQNMEELQSTNEEWHRKEKELMQEIAELKSELGR
jgi:HAMP domain-containing protein/putative methionine-R-sulfoxide reductase with GAF domain